MYSNSVLLLKRWQHAYWTACSPSCAISDTVSEDNCLPLEIDGKRGLRKQQVEASYR